MVSFRFWAGREKGSRRVGWTFQQQWPLISHNAVLITGCVFHTAVLFSDSIGAGGFVYNVAGTVFITGCVFNANGGLYQSSGIGYLFFNSAGLTVVTVRTDFLSSLQRLNGSTY
jgi:hypothetical protein